MPRSWMRHCARRREAVRLRVPEDRLADRFSAVEPADDEHAAIVEERGSVQHADTVERPGIAECRRFRIPELGRGLYIGVLAAAGDDEHAAIVDERRGVGVPPGAKRSSQGEGATRRVADLCIGGQPLVGIAPDDQHAAVREQRRRVLRPIRRQRQPRHERTPSDGHRGASARRCCRRRGAGSGGGRRNRRGGQLRRRSRPDKSRNAYQRLTVSIHPTSGAKSVATTPPPLIIDAQA